MRWYAFGVFGMFGVSAHRYAHVQNDPVNFIDPTGLRQCRDVNGNWFECGDDPQVVQIFTLTSTSLFGNYFLPAWESGHSPMIIGLIPGTPDDHTVGGNPFIRIPRSSSTSRSCPAGQGLKYTNTTITGGALSAGMIVDSKSQMYFTLGVGPSLIAASVAQTTGSGPREGLYLTATGSNGLAVSSL